MKEASRFWGFPVAAMVCLYSSAAAAQTTPVTPSAPHEALTFFEGTWTTEENAPASRFVETCGFMNAGRRHMICRSTWQTATGPREGMSIFSYNAVDSTYLYYGLRAGGLVEPMRGRILPNDGGWEFIAEKGTGKDRVRERVTITRIGPRRFRLVAESATGDGAWKTDGTQTYLPSTAQSSVEQGAPEAVAREFHEAMLRKDWPAAARLVDPAELARNKAMFRPVFQADTSRYLMLRVLNDTTTRAFDDLSDLEFNARLFAFATGVNSQRSAFNRFQGVEIFGASRPSDDRAFVIYQWTLPPDERPIRGKLVTQLRKIDGEWRMEMLGDFMNLKELLERQPD